MAGQTELSDRYLEVVQDLSRNGPSHLLVHLDREFIYKIDHSEDDYLQIKRADICKAIIKHNKNKKYEALEKIFEAYHEASFYCFLQSKLQTEPVKPQKGIKHPDFKTNLYGKDYYFEYKALKMLGGPKKYSDIAAEAHALTENARVTDYGGVKISMTEQIVQPYNKGRGFYSPRSPKMVIESIIDKAEQNIKSGQYSVGKTILVLDLNSQLSVFSDHEDEIKRTYSGEYNEDVSGVFYHAAAGKIGDEIYFHDEFEGKKSKIEILDKQGILLEHPEIVAVLFHVAPFGKSKGYSSVMRKMSREKFDGTLIELLKYLTNAHCCTQVEL